MHLPVNGVPFFSFFLSSLDRTYELMSLSSPFRSVSTVELRTLHGLQFPSVSISVLTVLQTIAISVSISPLSARQISIVCLLSEMFFFFSIP